MWLEPRGPRFRDRNTPERAVALRAVAGATRRLGPGVSCRRGLFPSFPRRDREGVHPACAGLVPRGSTYARWERWNESSRNGKKRRNTIKNSSRPYEPASSSRKETWKGSGGNENALRDDVYDSAALVEMHLEICAMRSRLLKAGMESLRERLHAFQVQLIARLYQIEVPKGGRSRVHAEKHSQR